jgi:hypothetical protein
VILALIGGVFVLPRRPHDDRGLLVNFLFLGLRFTLMESAVMVHMALLSAAPGSSASSSSLWSC